MLIALLYLIPLAHSDDRQINSHAHQGQPTKTNNGNSVTIALNGPNHFRFIGYYTAIEKGFYRDEGLNVELIARDNPNENNTNNNALTLDKAGQYGVSNGNILAKALNKEPVVLVAQIFQQSPKVFIALKDSNINSIKDLGGKRIALNNTLADSPLRSVLNQNLNVLANIEIISKTPDSINLLLNREIHAVSADIHTDIAPLLEKGIELQIVKPDTNFFYGDNLYTTKEESQHYQERVDKVRRATLKGWQYALDNQDEVIKLILKTYMPNASYTEMKQQAQYIKELILPNLFKLGNIDLSKLEKKATAYQLLGHTNSSKMPSYFIHRKQAAFTLTDQEREWIRNNPVVTYTAEINWPPYSFLDDNGKHVGVGRNLLRLISEITGINFKAVTGNWADVFEQAKKGEITLIPTFIFTQERSRTFAYSNSYGTNTPYFFTNQTRLLNQGENVNLNGKTVAMHASSGYIDAIERLYPQITILEFNSLKSCINAVLEGRADLLLDSHASAKYQLNNLSIASIKELKPLDSNSSDGIYMGALKENRILIDIIDKSLKAIPNEEKQKILDYWLGFTSSDEFENRIQLTPQELTWITQNPKLKFAGDPNRMPFESFDENGNYVGIVSDYLNIIEKQLDIKFNIVRTGSWQETLKRFKANQIDIISDTTDSSLTQSYSFSDGYLETPIVILMQDSHHYIDSLDQLENKTIAIVSDYSYADKIRNIHPHLVFNTVATTQDGLKALSNGEVDAFISTAVNATYQIKHMGISNVRIVGKTAYTTSLGFIVSKDMRAFVPILNKVINNIDLKTTNSILNNWTKESTNTIIDYALIQKILIGVFLLALVIWLWIYSLQKEIKKRKLSERDLRDTNKRFTLAAQAASIGFWQFNVPFSDSKAPSLISDAVTLKLYNFKPNETPSWEQVASRIHDADREKVRKFKLAAIQQNGVKKTLKEEFRVVHPNGEIRHLYSAVMNDNEGTHESDAKLIGISWDITDLKRSQEAAEQAKIAADNANRAKTEFLSNMSHEIRTPMNAILGFTELIDESVKDRRTKSFIKTIRSAGKSLLAIINDILDLSKIEAGKMEIKPTPCDLQHLLEDVSGMFLIKAKEKDLDIVVDFDPNMPRFIWIDEARVRQVLFNLIGNAVKFTESGHIIIRARRDTTKSTDISFTDFNIDIEDTGIGISKDDQEKIFQSFEQVSGQDNRKYGGTGLGLAISLKLAKLMGGDITLESQEGSGSTFSLQLSKVKLCINDSTPQITQQENLELLQFEPSKVLIVDDTENNRLLLASNLENKGFTVTMANNGLEAVNLAQQEAFDIILMDIRMPIMDGYEAAEKIREFSDTPIIALTASVSSEVLKPDNESYFASFMQKPVTRHDLYNEIAKHIPYALDKTALDETAFYESPRVDNLSSSNLGVDNLSATNLSTNARVITHEDQPALDISQFELSLLPQVLDELNKMKDRVAGLQESNNIQDIEKFNQDIGKLTQVAPIKVLQLLHEKLLQDLYSFDVGGIKQGLSEFCMIVNELNIMTKRP